jgi:hypothetical protein
VPKKCDKQKPYGKLGMPPMAALRTCTFTSSCGGGWCGVLLLLLQESSQYISQHHGIRLVVVIAAAHRYGIAAKRQAQRLVHATVTGSTGTGTCH